MSNYKRCSGCGESKKLEQFSRNRDSSDGYQSNCKVCDIVIGRANRWQRERGVSERMARRVLEEIQGETCPLCFHKLVWRDIGMQLVQDSVTHEQLGFVHQKCVVDAAYGNMDTLASDPPFRRANGGEPFYTPVAPKQESFL